MAVDELLRYLSVVDWVAFERIPGLRVTVADEELPAKYGGVIFGLKALPVAW
ncbi:hypothetical protein ACFLIM_43890 [Nonomuraea sp. M3C6]|uniref:Uncharacterized protein n=1 Tax=Nonomuraea marmarensis TaxID=3351344 RepID=A0ABW7ART6_9ACTN